MKADNSAGPTTAAPAAVSVEPFAALDREIAAGNSTKLRFKRTPLDNRVTATAQVAVREQTLMVRVRADQLPKPSRYNQQYYVLWADLPNYGQKLYIGDLPLTLSRRAARSRRGRGASDTAYYFPRLPAGAVFGGLMLTAEPKRFVPIPSEPLQLLLVAVPPKKNADRFVASSPTKSPRVSTTAEREPKPKGTTAQQPK